KYMAFTLHDLAFPQSYTGTGPLYKGLLRNQQDVDVAGARVGLDVGGGDSRAYLEHGTLPGPDLGDDRSAGAGLEVDEVGRVAVDDHEPAQGSNRPEVERRFGDRHVLPGVVISLRRRALLLVRHLERHRGRHR